MKKKNKYLDSISSILGDLVSPETAADIMNDLTYKPSFYKFYKKGNIMTAGESRKLEKGKLVHILYHDEDGNLRCDEIDELVFVNQEKDEIEISTKHGFSVSVKNEDPDDLLLENRERSGWNWTLSNVEKK